MLKKQFTLHSTYKEVMNFNSEMKNLYSLSKLNEQHQKELEIVQVESLNNIVRHSYLAKPNGIIQVEVRIENNIWECIIKDYGISRTFFDVPDLEFDPADIQNLPEGGMCLFLINKLTDFNEYKIFDTHNEFYLRKNILD